MKKIKLLAGIVVLYCVLQAALSYFFYLRFTQDVNDHMATSHKHFTTTYQNIFGSFRQVPKTIFEGMINLPHVVKLIKEATMEDADKDLIRKQLFSTFNSFYTDTLQPLGFRQLQFHLKGGERLLQFFDPLSFGDNPLETNHALWQINNQQKYLEGLSLSPMHRDYHYYFPLFMEGAFVGSVELSIPLEYFTSKAKNLLHSQEAILYSTAALKAVLSAKELSSLSSSFLSKEFSYDATPESAFQTTIKHLSSVDAQEVLTLLKAKQAVSYVFKDKQEDNHILHSLPLKNFKNATIGYVISLQKDKHIGRYYHEMVLDNIVFALLLVLAFILFFMYKKQHQLFAVISAHKEDLESTIEERTKELSRYNSFLQSTFEAIPSPLFLKDKEGRFLKCNSAFCNVFGKSKEEIVGKLTHQVMEGSLADEARDADKSVLRNGSAYNYELTLDLDGELYDYIVHKNVLKEDGEITGIVGILQDITRRKNYQIQLEDALEANRMQQEILAQDNHIINHYTIYVKINPEGLITDVSSALCSISGYEVGELIGKRYETISAQSKEVEEIKKSLFENDTWNGTLACQCKDGNTYWLKTSILPQFDDTGLKTGYIAFGTDISNEMRIKGIVYLDDLTQVYNRKKLNESLEEALSVVKRYPDESTAFILFDIDDFKAVNDKHGHLVGDSVLKELSLLVRESLRDVDTFARWGGEEFAILVPKTSLRGAIKLTEKLRTLISTHSFKGVGQMTCSFGLTEIKAKDTIDDLIKRADEALYYSKDKGKNRIEILG